MNNSWDKQSPVMGVTFWQELALRLLPGALVFCFAGSYRFHRVATAAEDAGYEVLPMLAWVYGTGMGFGRFHSVHKTHMVGAQALRPALEPVIVLQRDREGLSKSSCLETYGTGGINVKGSMIAHGEKLTSPSNVMLDEYSEHMIKKGVFRVIQTSTQRFSTGVIYASKASTKERDGGLDHMERQNYGIYHARKQGSMSGGVRLKRNPHPTVKPLTLTIALAKMLLPPDGFEQSIIVPFAGVGSEVIGAAKAGFKEISAIEINRNYTDIAMHRFRFHTERGGDT
jgi:site-specific DNA-methyltransferase (adenine-specific)